LRLLVDKNVVRRWFEAILNSNVGKALTDEQELVLVLLATAYARGAEIYITVETYNILTNIIRNPPITKAIIANVEVLYPSQLFRRWVKRIEKVTRLRREDAKILAYGSLGTSISKTQLGVDKILTLDKGLTSEFKRKEGKLIEELETLVKASSPPYNRARLPEVIQPRSSKLANEEYNSDQVLS